MVDLRAEVADYTSRRSTEMDSDDVNALVAIAERHAISRVNKLEEAAGEAEAALLMAACGCSAAGGFRCSRCKALDSLSAYRDCSK